MNFMKNLASVDYELFNILEREKERQENEIELIASENYASIAVLETMSSVLNNKYSEGYVSKRYYGGNAIVDELESLAIARLKELFKAEHANVQPLSGSPANAAVYMAFLEPGDKVLGLKLDHGGHLSHGHHVNFSGRLYNFVQYGVEENGLIDMKKVREIALRERPKMIVAGFSAYSRNLDWKAFREIADEIGAYTFADIAHIAGLIAGGLLDSPVPYFDVVSSTTHKTLRGPRGAFILCKEKFAKQVGPHNHINAAKAVAFKEALKPEFKDYCKQVIANSKKMAETFLSLGYNIVSGGTDNHLLVVDLKNKNISGLEFERILEKVGISVSRSTIPNDTASPLNPSGVRMGSPAITTRGFKESDVENLVKIIDLLLQNKDKEDFILETKNKINNICKKFPIYNNF